MPTTTTYLIIFAHIDNRATVTLGDNQFFDVYLDNDPLIDGDNGTGVIELPAAIGLFPIALKVAGYNGRYAPPRQQSKNPYHFEYKIVSRTRDTATGVIINEIEMFRDSVAGMGNPDVWLYLKKFRFEKNPVTLNITLEVEP